MFTVHAERHNAVHPQCGNCNMKTTEVLIMHCKDDEVQSCTHHCSIYTLSPTLSV